MIIPPIMFSSQMERPDLVVERILELDRKLLMPYNLLPANLNVWFKEHR